MCRRRSPVRTGLEVWAWGDPGASVWTGSCWPLVACRVGVDLGSSPESALGDPVLAGGPRAALRPSGLGLPSRGSAREGAEAAGPVRRGSRGWRAPGRGGPALGVPEGRAQPPASRAPGTSGTGSPRRIAPVPPAAPRCTRCAPAAASSGVLGAVRARRGWGGQGQRSPTTVPGPPGPLEQAGAQAGGRGRRCGQRRGVWTSRPGTTPVVPALYLSGPQRPLFETG